MATKRKNAVNKKKRRTRLKNRKSPPKSISAFVGNVSIPWLKLPDWSPLMTAKFVIGLLLLPLCWVSLETFFVSFGQATLRGNFWKTPEFWFFGIGSAIWLALFFLARSRTMLWIYVAGHELTHAFFVLLCRGNVSEVHISAEGGHILTNRNNFLISLSPYLFPFYTMVGIAIWALLEWAVLDFNENHLSFLFAFIGFSWMFHLTFTVWMIKREQPDVDQNGKLFSFSLITLVNLLVISTLLIVASPTVTFPDFSMAWLANVWTFGGRFVDSVREIKAMIPGSN